MMTTIKKKLKSNTGESIAETLVAVLIAAFALLMLAGTINTASSLITKSQDTLDEYYRANNAMTTRNSTGTTGTFEIKDGETSIISCSVSVYSNASKLGEDRVSAYDYVPPTA